MPRIVASLLTLPVLALGACASNPAPVKADLGLELRAQSVVAVPLANDPARVTEALLNRYRAARGLAPVMLDPQMTAVAAQQAQFMAAADHMDHNIRGDYGARLKANKVLNVYGGENIGRNLKTPEKMFEWWAASPTHIATMSNPKVTRLGFAVAYTPNGRPYWAMALASPPAY